jgi:histidyl-tRNA synthetase
VAVLVPEARDFGLRLQRALRKAGVRVMMDHEGRGLKSQMKRADKLGARFVAILGEDEMAKARWTIRDMKSSTQEEVGLDAAAAYLIKETTVG